MAKPGRNKNGHRPAPPDTVDSSVAALAQLADDDASNHLLDPIGAQRRALGDRKMFEKISGKLPARRRDLQQADERDALTDEEAEEEEEIDPEDDRETDPDEDGEEGEAAEATQADPRELKRALQALRRVKAPAWVFDQDEDRILALAESLSDFQRNTDDAIRRRDETIGALSQAIGKKGSPAEADEESPAKGNAEEDLEESATALAREMGLEESPGLKKALIDYGKKARGKTGKALESAVGELRSGLQALVLDKATTEFRRLYPELASDSDAEASFLDSFREHARLPRYSKDFSKLVRVSAHAEFGEPKPVARTGDAPRRKPSAPAMHTRADRSARVLDEGTDDHDRAVYSRVMKARRSGFAVRR